MCSSLNGRSMVSTRDISDVPFRNEILANLPHAEMSALRPHLTRVRLVNRQSLHEPGQIIEHVFFVEQGFVSMVAESGESSGGRIEVGLTGRESMVGLTVMLEPHATSFNRMMVQLPGFAYRMPAEMLRKVAGSAPFLSQRLLRALQGALAQIAQTAACNSRHTLPERLARWLLMAHDRVDGDELVLTQEFLSIMLAVRRAGVTIAIGSLQTAGVMRHLRGRLTITDRPGLEAATCGCYSRLHAFTDILEARNLAADQQKLHSGA